MYELKVSGNWSVVSFQYNVKTLHLADNENKLHEALDYWSRDMLNFDFLEKSQGIISLPHLENEVSKKIIKMVIMLLCLSIVISCLIAFTSWDMANMCIAVVH